MNRVGEPNYPYWLDREEWDLTDAVFLCLGKNPPSSMKLGLGTEAPELASLRLSMKRRHPTWPKSALDLNQRFNESLLPFLKAGQELSPCLDLAREGAKYGKFKCRISQWLLGEPSAWIVEPESFMRWWNHKASLPELPKEIKAWLAERVGDDREEPVTHSETKTGDTDGRSHRALEYIKSAKEATFAGIWLLIRVPKRCRKGENLNHEPGAVDVKGMADLILGDEFAQRIWKSKKPQLPKKATLIEYLQCTLRLNPELKRTLREHPEWDTVRDEYLLRTAFWCIATNPSECIRKGALNVDRIVGMISENEDRLWAKDQFQWHSSEDERARLNTLANTISQRQ